ncbi:MAG: S24 family peptidase, partial [Gammaproteobacteria bacterium]
MTEGCAANEPYALRVMGDSMEPEFPDGIVIIVEPGGVLQSGSYVVAMHEGQHIFRQLVIEEGERWLLCPLKEGYPTLEISGSSAIKGVVVQKAG